MRDLHNLKELYRSVLREFYFESSFDLDEDEDDFEEWLKGLTLKEIQEITGEE
jgi:hypothetical protein